VSAEILKAVRNGDPVVALESTIITHGMPFPKNYEMSLKVKKILRDRVRNDNIKSIHDKFDCQMLLSNVVIVGKAL
jgi:pseudouridine-5'-phosphate glycosidase